jgi:hypothetical protein
VSCVFLRSGVKTIRSWKNLCAYKCFSVVQGRVWVQRFSWSA